MKARHLLYCLAGFLALCACGKGFNGNPSVGDGGGVYSPPSLSDFEKLQSGNLPYRKGDLHYKDAPILVVYLHGGTSRGTDNEAPIKEKAVSIIRDYLVDSNIPAIFIIPQCPPSENWGASMNSSLSTLIGQYENDCIGVYILGGSMGGTGTWSLANAYPQRFSGIMPVAGKPGTASASNFADLKVYAVMSEADEVMTNAYEDVSAFIQSISAAGGRTKYDQIPASEGWTHAVTCEKAYDKDRLDWLFKSN